MTSSNSFSTDQPDDFPEVADYSGVDDLEDLDELDAQLDELDPELAGTKGLIVETTAEPMPERLAAELAERVGLDLTDDAAVPFPPVDPAEDDGHVVAARAGWFPPVPARPEPPWPPEAIPAEPAAEAEEPAMSDEPHPIDQVAIRKLGGFNFLSIGQWSGLPRDERARLLKGRLVMFLYEGDEVEARPALLWLQQLSRTDDGGSHDPSIRRRGR